MHNDSWRIVTMSWTWEFLYRPWFHIFGSVIWRNLIIVKGYGSVTQGFWNSKTWSDQENEQHSTSLHRKELSQNLDFIMSTRKLMSRIYSETCIKVMSSVPQAHIESGTSNLASSAMWGILGLLKIYPNAFSGLTMIDYIHRMPDGWTELGFWLAWILRVVYFTFHFTSCETFPFLIKLIFLIVLIHSAQ